MCRLCAGILSDLDRNERLTVGQALNTKTTSYESSQKPTSGPNSFQIETALPSGARSCCVLWEGAQHGIKQIRTLKVGFISGLLPLYG